MRSPPKSIIPPKATGQRLDSRLCVDVLRRGCFTVVRRLGRKRSEGLEEAQTRASHSMAGTFPQRPSSAAKPSDSEVSQSRLTKGGKAPLRHMGLLILTILYSTCQCHYSDPCCGASREHGWCSDRPHTNRRRPEPFGSDCFQWLYLPDHQRIRMSCCYKRLGRGIGRSGGVRRGRTFAFEDGGE